VAHELGLEIPRQLSVVGFDDSATALRLWPVLTSVRLPVRDMGAIATDKLFGRQSNKRPSESEVTDIFPKLIIRESTAAPPE